jgi:hypothetical protein
MKIIVLHESYGCDTGCCGHTVYVDGEMRGNFKFEHPRSYEPYMQSVPDFIRELVTEELGEEHVKDIDWENCVVIDD